MINADILNALVDLADQVGLTDPSRDAMFAGEHINVTEDRAVLHTALRAPEASGLVVDGTDVIPEVHQVLAKVYAFADKVRSGEWVGVTGKPIATVVNIGIGGSDLGPVMVYEALQPYVKSGLQARFVSNIDPTDVAEKTKDLDPESTLFIVASKTFTTLETLTNARLARSWLLDSLREAGAIEAGEDAANAAVCQALCRGIHCARQSGCVRHRARERLRILGLGRRALFAVSAIGLSLVLRYRTGPFRGLPRRPCDRPALRSALARSQRAGAPGR